MDKLAPLPVSLHTRLFERTGVHYLVHYANGSNAIVWVQHPGHRPSPPVMFFSNRWYRRRRFAASDISELGDVAVTGRRSRPRTAYLLPSGSVQQRLGGWFIAAMTAIAVALIIALMYGAATVPDFPVLMLGPMAALVWGGLFAALPQGGHRYETDEGTLPLAEIVAPQEDITAGDGIVDEIKAEYGALLSDVVYRIERPALFDPADDRTASFTELMARWDDHRGRLRPDQRIELATELRVAFDAAKAHAETIGLDHLPHDARPKAAVAAKAMRLATDENAPTAERQAALAKATDILASLLLYYLPQPDEVLELVGGKRRRALPGRVAEVRT